MTSPKPDIDLSPRDQEYLLRELSEVTDAGIGRNLLFRLGIPHERIPSSVGIRTYDWWRLVFVDFDNGIVPQPYRRLLIMLAQLYPANHVFLVLVERYIGGPPRESIIILEDRNTADPSNRHTRVAGRIFLGHSSADKQAARDLYARLRRAGRDPWLDEEDLLPGHDWHFEITKAIKDSAFFLALLSKDSINKRGYLQTEIRRALDVADMMPEGAIFLIPVRLEECEVPERLARWQWVDLFRPHGYAKLLRALEGSPGADQ